MSGYDPENIFGKIIRGEIPSHKIHEDDDVLVMMDLFPQSRGHCLVLPKRPSRNLLDAEPRTLAVLIAWVQRIGLAAKAALNADGIRIAQFNEAPAGQTVFHLHIHVIPVYGDGPVGEHRSGRAADAELAVIAKAISARL